MLYKTDYHIHTLYSDGKATPEEYIEVALSAGMKEIGFSEHLNLVIEKQEWCMEIPRVPEYVSHINKLAASEKRIKVRLGLEVDYFPGKKTLYMNL